MNPSHQIPTEGHSDRAAAGVKSALSHLPGKKQQPTFAGEGMHRGDTVPKSLPNMTKPAKGATPPTALNPMQRPGAGAINPTLRKAKA